jgi:hypothetical protein
LQIELSISKTNDDGQMKPKPPEGVHCKKIDEQFTTMNPDVALPQVKPAAKTIMGIRE